MFDSWPTDCRIIAESRQPYLCRHNADFYQVGVNKQVRVGWYLPNRKKTPWVALLTWKKDGRVNLKLRVSRDSGLHKPVGPLHRSIDYDINDSEKDTGNILISKELPKDLPQWVDNAFQHCVKRYGIEWNEGLATDPYVELTTVDSDFTISSPNAANLEASVDRVSVTIQRIVRDTALANHIKRLHNHYCQICGQTILKADGSGYSEGHHLQPLGGDDNGPDISENIICVCPNHHAMCDFGAMALNMAELRLVDGHVIGQEFLDYHNMKIFCDKRLQ